jgi:hypothetical protein
MKTRLPLAVAAIVAVQMLTGVTDAQAVAVEDLNGATLNMTTGYAMRVKRAEGIFSTNVTVVWNLKIGPEGKIAGTITRTVTTPRGPRTTSRKMNGTIGVPRQAAVGSGHALWILDGDKLTLLRTFETGGLKAEITLNGSSCSVRAPMVREEGAGNMKRSDSVVGGPVEILSATPTSTSCRISR